MTDLISEQSRYRGCLLGGAVGDALGAPVEFHSRDAILKRSGNPKALAGTIGASRGHHSVQ